MTIKRIIKWITIFCLFENTKNQLYEGDNCTLSLSNEKGLCINIDKCLHAKKLLLLAKTPQHCRFSVFSPIVCCPLNETIRPPGNKTQEFCNKHNNPPPPVRFITLGKKVLSWTYPHMAAIGFEDGKTIHWLCGGSLISNEYILTAAHCLYQGNAKWVKLGYLQLTNKENNSTRNNATIEDFAIQERIPHLQYKLPAKYNDIALLRIRRIEDKDFRINIKPGCLYNKKELPSTKPVAIGWGKTSFAGDGSNHLMEVDLNYLDNESCKKRFPAKSRSLPNGILEESQMCAGDTNAKDTCEGDSGGPLQSVIYGNRLHYVITGITSFGKACGVGNTAGVYTRVSYYIPWIESIVWP